jgi:hypothetical protein
MTWVLAPEHEDTGGTPEDAEDKCFPIAGITASLSVHPQVIRKGDSVAIIVSMHNTTKERIKFRHYASVGAHLELLDSVGEFVFHKNGAPVWDVGCVDVDINPGGVAEWRSIIFLDEFYTLQSNRYRIRLRYDLRLIQPEVICYPWISWTNMTGVTIQN